MRSRLAVLALVALLALSLPVAAATVSDPPTATYGADGDPSFLVEYENDSFDSLEAWADSSDRRVLREHHADANLVVLSAPKFDVRSPSVRERAAVLASTSPDFGTAFENNPLSDRSYVVSVETNRELPIADPVALENSSAVELADAPRRMKYSAYLPGNDHPASLDTAGIAFDSDAERTTMADSRAAIDVGTVSETGNGTTVAVVDTGCNVADGQIFGNGTIGSDIRILNASKNTIDDETVNDSGYSAIADGADSHHGTWVASAIAANASNESFDGVSPDADVLCMKALADDGSGETGDIVEAIRYSADQNVDVISMSLGSPLYSEALVDAIEYAEEQGSTVVVAVGNSRQTTRWTASPADAMTDGTIAVAATNVSANTTAQSAYFSQIGPDPGLWDNSELESQGAMPTVAAPGMETAALVADENGFITSDDGEALSGTSMSTPKVSGVVLLTLEANPSLEPADVHDRIADTAKPINNAAVAEVGNGMVSAENAVAGTEPTTDQEDAMTDEAKGRDLFYKEISKRSGGILPKILSMSLAGLAIAGTRRKIAS